MRRLALVAFCLGLFFAGAPSANASDRSKFNRPVVFGDSLSDNGNSLFLFEVPQTPYYNGRYSNGPNWVDYFPFVAHHHFPTVTAYFPNPDNGTNFAVGDSISADLLESEPTGFPAQIPSYLASTGGEASPEDFYVIWIGANDFSAGISPIATVQNIRNGITRLREAGARTFIVISVPDLSLTPAVIASGAAVAAKQFVLAVNALLTADILSYACSSGIRLELVDINLIFTQLVDNPGKFGFANSTGAAFNPHLPLSSSNPMSDPNDYVFWDGFHPTTKAHYIAAEFIYRTLASRRLFPEALPLWADQLPKRGWQ